MKTVHLNHYKLIRINIKSQSPYKLVLRVFLMSQTKTTKFHSLGLLQNIFSMPVACGLERLKEPALQINFNQDNTMQDLLGFNPGIIYDKIILSLIPVVILTFDNILFETDIAQNMIFRMKWTGKYTIGL